MLVEYLAGFLTPSYLFSWDGLLLLGVLFYVVLQGRKGAAIAAATDEHIPPSLLQQCLAPLFATRQARHHNAASAARSRRRPTQSSSSSSSSSASSSSSSSANGNGDSDPFWANRVLPTPPPPSAAAAAAATTAAASITQPPKTSTTSTSTDLAAAADYSLSPPPSLPPSPLQHLAIIMDGNRRYGRERFSDPLKGHWEGGRALSNVSKWCLEKGIKHLTVYAFSTENWRRDPAEISALMHLFTKYAQSMKKEAVNSNIQIKVLSTDTSRLPPHVQAAMTDLESSTASCTSLVLNLCVSYGSRGEITHACQQLARAVAAGTLHPDQIDEAAFCRSLLTSHSPGTYLRPPFPPSFPPSLLPSLPPLPPCLLAAGA
jgi:undecaprenyl diphosphate synthase